MSRYVIMMPECEESVPASMFKDPRFDILVALTPQKAIDRFLECVEAQTMPYAVVLGKRTIHDEADLGEFVSLRNTYRAMRSNFTQECKMKAPEATRTDYVSELEVLEAQLAELSDVGGGSKVLESMLELGMLGKFPVLLVSSDKDLLGNTPDLVAAHSSVDEMRYTPEAVMTWLENPTTYDR